MKITSRFSLMSFTLIAPLLPLCGCQSGGGAPMSGHTPPESSLSAEAKAAYKQLLAVNEGAAALAKEAKGVLVFPSIIKGGFIIGGFHGEGAKLQNGRVTGYYDTTAVSYGLQAGLQTYAYALFFMNDKDLHYLDSSSGWEIGVGPTVTIVDEGVARSLTTTTLRSGVYCFFFDQKGLMAGLGLQGSKITRLDR